MTKDEYTQLSKIWSISPTIKISDIKNPENRTLIYGYNKDRETFHLYLYEGMFVILWYSYPDILISFAEETELDPDMCIPNKRIYPECCDFEFCALLRKYDVSLPFTNWNEYRETKQHYGLLKGEIDK